MIETIKDIKGYEGVYKISSKGYVISLPRKHKKCRVEQILKVSRKSKDSKSAWVSLSRNGFVERLCLHKLINEHFEIKKPLD